MKGKRLLIVGAALALAVSGCASATRITRANPLRDGEQVAEALAFHFDGATVHGSETSYNAREADVNSASASKISSAHWQITVGNNSAQLGTNAKSGNLSKATLGNGNFAAASGLASALSIQTNTQKYSAAICTTGMENIIRGELVFTGTNGGNMTKAWLLSSTNGTAWTIEDEKTSSITTGTEFSVTKSSDAKQFAFVAYWNLTNSGGLKGFEFKLYGEYANFVQTYGVTYDKNGATGGSVPVDDNSYETGDEVTVLGNTGSLTKEDYAFGGWSYNESVYSAGDKLSVGEENVTLVAVWVLDIEEGIDYLNREFTGVSGTTYSDWSGKTGASGAVYAGNSAGSNDSIQLRSNDDHQDSGVITTTSGGNAKNVSVVWNSNTEAGRTLNVYGKNTAYSSASDLFNSNSKLLYNSINNI